MLWNRERENENNGEEHEASQFANSVELAILELKSERKMKIACDEIRLIGRI